MLWWLRRRGDVSEIVFVVAEDCMLPVDQYLASSEEQTHTITEEMTGVSGRVTSDTILPTSNSRVESQACPLRLLARHLGPVPRFLGSVVNLTQGRRFRS